MHENFLIVVTGKGTSGRSVVLFLLGFHMRPKITPNSRRKNHCNVMTSHLQRKHKVVVPRK